ncbi:MAG: ABC transporter permease, partial [Stellaceae bacterium]
MFSYIIHRLLIMIPTLIAISIVVFTIINLPPGNYFTTYVAELQGSGETTDMAKVKFLETEYGFDRPLWQQYLYWVGGLLHGDMGYSFSYDLPVNKVVGDRMLLTAIISITTIIFTYLVAFPIGVYSATHQYSWSDHFLTLLGFLGLAT